MSMANIYPKLKKATSIPEMLPRGVFNFQRRKRVLLFVLSVLVLIFSYNHFLYHIQSEPFINDEISWYFHTEFFDKAFIKHDFSSQFWTSYEGFDQPPLAKYFYGYCLYSADPDYAVKRNELLNRYGRWQFYFNQNLLDTLNTSQFAPEILALRYCNSVNGIVAALGMFVLLYVLSGSMIAAFVTTILILYTPLYSSVSARATNDAQWFGLSVWMLVSYLYYLKTTKRGYYIAAAVLAGLSVGSKLTGLMVVFGLVFHKILRYSVYGFSAIERRYCVVFFSVFCGVWLLINPTLWSSPIVSTLDFFRFRTRQTQIFQLMNTGPPLYSISEKANAVISVMFIPVKNILESSGLLTKYWILQTGILIIGLVALWRKNSDTISSVALTASLTLLTVGIATLPVLWDRYFLPFYIPVGILFSTGITWIITKYGCIILKYVQNHYAYIIFLSVSVLFLYPQMQFREPNLLDIIETWAIGTNVKDQAVLMFHDAAGIRPLYVLFIVRAILNSLFHYFSPYYFLYYSILLSLTLYVGYKSIIKQSVRLDVAAIITFIFLISPVTVDTYWRLGAAESLFAFLLVASLYFLVQSKFFLATITILLQLFVKETSVFITPVFIAYLLYKKRRIPAFGIGIGFIYLLYKLILLSVSANADFSGYLTMYSPELVSIVDMFWYYIAAHAFYIVVFFVSVVLFILREKSKNYVYELMLIGLIIANMASLTLFHNKNQPYYFYPTMVVILVFFLRELSLLQKQYVIAVLGYMSMMFFLLKIPWFAYDRALFWNEDYTGDGALIREIQHAPPSVVYEFEHPRRPDYPPALELYQHMKPYTEPTRFVKVHYVQDETPDGYQTLCAQSFFGSNVCKWKMK